MLIEKLEIPKDWEIVKLSKVAYKITDGSHNPPKGKSFGIPMISAKDVYNNTISFVNPRFISEDDFHSENKRTQIKPGDILLTIVATIGRTAVVKENTKPFTLQRSVAVIKTELNPSFLCYYFQSPYFQRQLTNSAKGTAQKGVYLKTLNELKIILPPKNQQQKIVSKIEELLSELDKGIEELKSAQQQLKVYRQAVLKWAFEGKLTNKGLKGNELPTGWKIFKLKDITLEKEGLRRGPFGSAIKKEFFVPSGYKVYEQGNAINDDPYRGSYYVDKVKYNELINFNVIPEDLIVSCSGVTLGRISEIPKDAKPGIINQALLRIRLKKDLILNKFFIMQFRASFFQKIIFDQSQGTAMPNLVGIKDFKEVNILLPPISEQKIIIQEIECRLSVCNKIEETILINLKRAQALRHSILKKAFEGKLITI